MPTTRFSSALEPKAAGQLDLVLIAANQARGESLLADPKSIETCDQQTPVLTVSTPLETNEPSLKAPSTSVAVG